MHLSKQEILNLVDLAAYNYSLEPKLIRAIAITESNLNPYAVRYEKAFKYLFQVDELAKKVGCTKNTMHSMQKTSWGIMQVMGAVAYENGLAERKDENERWASAMLNPILSIDVGCSFIREKVLKKSGLNPKSIYAVYNAGSIRLGRDGKLVNHDNVERFFKIYKSI